MKKNLRAVSENLKNVKIICDNYTESANFIDEKTFVYFNPPYRPLTEMTSFTAYTENLFNAEEQIAEFVERMHRKIAKVVVSNIQTNTVRTERRIKNNGKKIYNNY